MKAVKALFKRLAKNWAMVLLTVVAILLLGRSCHHLKKFTTELDAYLDQCTEECAPHSPVLRLLGDSCWYQPTGDSGPTLECPPKSEGTGQD